MAFTFPRHCEEPQATWQSSDVSHDALDCFASLAMTTKFTDIQC